MTTSPFILSIALGIGKPYGADRLGVIKQIPLFTGACLRPAPLLQATFWYLHTHTHVSTKCEQNLMWSFTYQQAPQFHTQWGTCVLSCFSCVWPFATPWTVAHQDPLSMGLSRQEYWSGLPWPPSGDLPDPRMEPASLMPSALAGGFFTTSATRSPSKGILAVYAQNICPLLFRTCPKQTKLSLLKTIIKSQMDINPVYISQILSRSVPAPTCWSTLTSSRHRPVWSAFPTHHCWHPVANIWVCFA